MVAKLHAIEAELRRRMHEPIASVGEWLHKVVLATTDIKRFREISTGYVSSGNVCAAFGGWF